MKIERSHAFTENLYAHYDHNSSETDFGLSSFSTGKVQTFFSQAVHNA